MDIISKCSRVSSSMNENSSIYRELTGLVFSLTLNQPIVIGCDHFINVLKDHKPILSWFTEKRQTLSTCFYSKEKQIPKTLYHLYEGKKFFCCWFVKLLFYTKWTATELLKAHTIAPQFRFAKRISDKQIKPVLSLVEHETIFLTKWGLSSYFTWFRKWPILHS